MRFGFTPLEAQATARALAAHFRRRHLRVSVETSPWADSPYRTTLRVKEGGMQILVECQGTLTYTPSLRALRLWIHAQRHYAELYLATSEDAPTEARQLADLRKDGVGLFLVSEDGRVSKSAGAANPALIVQPDPTLSYGHCSSEVAGALAKFNEMNRKDGLRDMCELVERETLRVALKASKKGWVTVGSANIEAMQWSNQIDLLASTKSYAGGKPPLLSTTLKDDLHSFRGARNLVDHKVKTKREDTKRQKQFSERMAQGPRLVAELVGLNRKIK